MAKLLLFPALIMSFAFGTYFGYSSRPAVESTIQVYQAVKSVALDRLSGH